MKCGAKCFIVEMEENATKKHALATVRTPASARKLVRKKYGKDVSILSVREKKRDN